MAEKVGTGTMKDGVQCQREGSPDPKVMLIYIATSIYKVLSLRHCFFFFSPDCPKSPEKKAWERDKTTKSSLGA